MREELEQKAVEDSVTFDRVNNKVMVNLPKRGKEEFFLSSNRDIALKVYRRICQRASKSEETKLDINYSRMVMQSISQKLSRLDLTSSSTTMFSIIYPGT